MGDSGWWLIIGLVTLVNPVVVVAGIASGLIVRRWWQVALGLVAAPAAYWLTTTMSRTTDPVALLPFLALGGLVWSAAVFRLKRAAAA